MNREERRNFVKNARKHGMPEASIQSYLEMDKLGFRQTSYAKEWDEDDKAMINVEQIQSRQGYGENTSQKYRNFIENNVDTVFTVHLDRDGLISFKEEPEWLFWSGDLKEVEVKE